MKIHITNIKYIVEDNIVTCKARVDFISKLDRKYFSNISKSAYLRENDKFDFEKGKRIALAKVENEAYKQGLKICKTVKISTEKAIKEADEFILKANNCITHNIEYIKRVDNNELKQLKK